MFYSSLRLLFGICLTTLTQNAARYSEQNEQNKEDCGCHKSCDNRQQSPSVYAMQLQEAQVSRC